MMGKRIQKLKAKQPRAIRLNRKKYITKYRQMVENSNCVNGLLTRYSEVSINSTGCMFSRMGVINNEYKDLEISFEINPIPTNPIISRIAEKMLDQLDMQELYYDMTKTNDNIYTLKYDGRTTS